MSVYHRQPCPRPNKPYPPKFHDHFRIRSIVRLGRSIGVVHIIRLRNAIRRRYSPSISSRVSLIVCMCVLVLVVSVVLVCVLGVDLVLESVCVEVLCVGYAFA